MFSQRTDSELGETLSPLRMEVTRTQLRRRMFSQNVPEMNPRAQKITTNRKKKTKLKEKRVRFLEYSQRYSTQPCTLTRKSPSRTVDAGANLLEIKGQPWTLQEVSHGAQGDSGTNAVCSFRLCRGSHRVRRSALVRRS